MAENMNSNQGEGDKNENPEDPANPQNSKNNDEKNQKNDQLTSKSDPGQEFNDTIESNETGDYISSYQYFLFYNSIKPVDPLLPKPTYKPKPNLDLRRGREDK